ncbi:endonuclease/exonuclease/phosphatase family protein [Plantactinospora sp. GCM10030261]|uniref:endonuclease/exonuclease/phosphatase family protein n=1 Tax=Plantactinospora sp. GCM10030261 TaxID=3273420 RepID=UPI00360B1C09
MAARSIRSRGRLVVLTAVLLAALIAGHRLIPNVRGLGSLVDTGVPYLGLAVPALAFAALLRRSRLGLAAVALPAVVWTVLVGAAWLPADGGPVRLRVVSQNLMAGNPDPAATVARLAGTGADLVAVQELTDGDRPAVEDALRASHPHTTTISTVGLWSRYPVSESSGVDTGLSWTRALRAVIDTPDGELVVYVVHLGSARAGATALRDRTVARLAERLRAEPARRLIVLGDFNTSTSDRVIVPLTSMLRDAQADAGRGPGFTWPAELPVMRPDQVLYRGLTAASAGVLRTPASDHRAVTAGFA